jgi:hypothetical protein
MILSRDDAYLDSLLPVAQQVRAILNVKPVALRVLYSEDVDLTDAPLWTDDYSDLLSVLRIPNWSYLLSSAEPAKKSEVPTSDKETR